MKLIKNTGNDRVMDALRAGLTPAAKLDIATPAFSIFAFAEFAAQLQSLSACRLVLPDRSPNDLQLLGSDADRAFRNQLTARWLARQCAGWISNRVEIRNTVVWKKLFKFQRDGVVGAIDKLARLGGCIIADSVGLGKTFEALAVIKYHESARCRTIVWTSLLDSG